jgi:hypothetical protein
MDVYAFRGKRIRLIDQHPFFCLSGQCGLSLPVTAIQKYRKIRADKRMEKERIKECVPYLHSKQHCYICFRLEMGRKKNMQFFVCKYTLSENAKYINCFFDFVGNILIVF